MNGINNNMSHNSKQISLADIEYLHEIFSIFGNPNSPYWFLGLEEGDHPKPGESIDYFVNKLTMKTSLYEKKGPVSLREMCGGGTHKFLPEIVENEKLNASDTKYQSTWGGYIKLLLSIDRARDGSNNPWNINDIKQYQKYHLGAINQNYSVPGSCLLELYPMARKGRKKGQWPYAELAEREGLAFMASAESYLKYATSRRTLALLSLVEKHNPNFVLCFGANCRDALLPLLGAEPLKLNIEIKEKSFTVPVVNINRTTFVFSRHPTSSGMSNSYWKKLGLKLADLDKQNLYQKAA